MAEEKLWLLLARKFNKEMAREDMEELKSLMRQNDQLSSEELMAYLQALTIKPATSYEDEQASRSKIKKSLELVTHKCELN